MGLGESADAAPAAPQETAPLPRPAPALGPADALIAAGLLAVTLGVCLPWAVRYRQEASALDRERVALTQRCGQVQRAVRYLEAKRSSESQIRKVASRYVADVQARKPASWPTVVSELSLRRPRGVWASSLSGDGAQFRAEVTTLNPALVSDYTRELRNSQYVEYAGTPAVEPAATRWSVVGRVRGE